jgi:hypothetical protein
MPSAYTLTSDSVRGDSLANLDAILDRGIRAALSYGDKDYQRNRLSGEALVLLESRT